MFLYITLYIQGVLDYSPLEAGVRFPAADAALVLRRPDRRPGARARSRPDADGHRPDPRRRRADPPCAESSSATGGRPAARLHRRRNRHRYDQPRDRLGCARGGRPARAGMASGINSTFRQVGIALALPRSVRSSRAGSNRTSLRRCPAAGLVRRGSLLRRRQSAVATAPPEFRAQALDAANTAFISAFNEILMSAAGSRSSARSRARSCSSVARTSRVAPPATIPPPPPTDLNRAPATKKKTG